MQRLFIAEALVQGTKIAALARGSVSLDRGSSRGEDTVRRREAEVRGYMMFEINDTLS